MDLDQHSCEAIRNYSSRDVHINNDKGAYLATTSKLFATSPKVSAHKFSMSD